MKNLLLTLWPDPRNVAAMLVRYALEYRSLWKAQIVRDLVDRLIYLFAFGFGMGALIKTMHGLPYLDFLVPGVAASTGAFVMTIAMTYGVFERSTSYRLYAAWLSTPVRLSEILLAELIYANLRSLPSIFILFALAGIGFGAIPSWSGTLLAIPILILANFAYGAVAMCFTVHIKRGLNFAYVNTLWTTPMFLFSGVFFDLHQTPWYFHLFSQVFPLTHVISLVRPLMTNQPVSALAATQDIVVLLALFLADYLYSCYRFQKRLLD